MIHPNGSEHIEGAIKKVVCKDGIARYATIQGAPMNDYAIPGFVKVQSAGKPYTVSGIICFFESGLYATRGEGYYFIADENCKHYNLLPNTPQGE